MKHLNTYEHFTEAEAMPMPISDANVEKIVELQKNKGGVIAIPDEEGVKEMFRRLGYEIKTITHAEALEDEQLNGDITNFNKVNYVVCFSPDETATLL